MKRERFAITFLTLFCSELLSLRTIFLRTRSNKAKWESDGRKMADPKYFESAHIPVLLGLNVIPQLYADGQEVHDGFILQNTKLGWIISGVTDTPIRRKVTKSNITFVEFLKSQSITSNLTLTEFEQALCDSWDIIIKDGMEDEVQNEFCERLFRELHRRTEDGRYVIPIPFRPDAPALGPSYWPARKFYLAHETSKQPRIASGFEQIHGGISRDATHGAS